MKLWIVNLVAGSLLLACRETVTADKNFIPGISVHCLLFADHHPQKIQVYRTTGWLTDITHRDQLFVEDARVSIEGELQRVQFHYYVDRHDHPVYIDRPDTLYVVPGRTYRLTVETDLGTIHGKTRLPGTFQVLAPARESVHRINNPLTARWSNSANASGYAVNLIQPPVNIPISPDSIWRSRAVYSVTVFDTTCRIPVYRLQEPGEYLLKVMAFDQYFKDHFYEGMDRSGIEGGWGFFGAAVVDTLHFRLEE